MKEKTKLKIVFYSTLLFILFLLVLSIFKQNYEFIYYSLIMGLVFVFGFFYYKKTHASFWIVIGVLLYGVSQALGGYIYIGGTRLYDLWLVQSVLRYDNLVHVWGIFVMTLAVHNMIVSQIHEHFSSRIVFILFIVIIGLGLGALGEIIEFGAVVAFDAGEQVGDYTNNALDLVFNLIGAIIAGLYAVFFSGNLENAS